VDCHQDVSMVRKIHQEGHRATRHTALASRVHQGGLYRVVIVQELGRKCQ
jgi:hypothetical protein